MQGVAVWQHSSNSNIKIVRNSIEHFLWNPSDFSPDDVFSCLWILFTNSFFQVTPSENSHVGWGLGNRMARGYWFDAKWVCPMGSYAWGIQVFCSGNEASPHFSNKPLEYLTRNLPWERLILHQTDNPWPSYSQDLKRPNYFLRGGSTWKTVSENNPQIREGIISREIRWIPLEMLNGVVDSFNVPVAAVLSYSSAVHGANIVLITGKV